jgi:hypothetical protein
VRITQPYATADIRASCTFVSTHKTTGVTGTASGTCSFTAVYENDRWWLCTSTFTGTITNRAFVIR